MKKLFILFLFLCSLAKGQEQRQVSPQLLNWDSSYKYWLFDESTTNTCLNSQFYFETFYDPTDLNSRNFKQFQYFLLYDEATWDARARETELAAATIMDNYSSHHSLQELFPSYNWSSITSSKVFYILIYYTTTSKCANTNYGPPYQAMMAIKRKFYPVPKNGTIKIVPEQVTSKTIEYNTDPGDFNGTNATGGDGSFSYQWQKKEGNGSWVDIYSGTSASYYPSELTVSTSFRRKDTPNKCGSALYTNEINITVLSNVSGGTIGTSQTVCYASNVTLTNDQAGSGGTGSYSYQWLSSSDGANFQSISGANGASYTASDLKSTTFYKRKCTSGENTAESNIVKITVRDNLIGGDISSSQTICYNSTPSQLVGGTPSGGDGNFTYNWEYSLNGVSWNTALSGSNSSYQPSALTATTYYRRTVTSGSGCGSVSSSSVTIAVRDQLTAGVIGSNQTICFATAPSQLVGSTPSGGDGSYTYVWESSVDGNSWNTVPGATNTSYQPGTLTNTTYFRRTVTSGSGCGSRTSSNVILTVNGSFNAGGISASQTICYGIVPAKLTGEQASGGFGTYTYQWKQSEDGQNFTDIPGAYDINFQPGILTKTTYYKRAATCGCGTKESAIITIVVNPELVGGNISSSQTICHNTIPTQISGAIPTGGNGSYTYKWESSANGSVWTTISGAASANYQPAALKSTTYYRRTVISGSGCGSNISSPVTITVNDILLPGSIYSSQSICYGSTPALITGAEATGGGGQYTYQWKGKDGTLWNNLPSGSSVNYQPGALTKTTYYKRFVTSGCGTVATDSIKIEVKNQISAGTISGAQTICYGSTPNELVGTNAFGGFESFNYQWQLSYDNVTYNDVASASGKNYQPGNINSNCYFRRMATDSHCGNFYTDPVLINAMTKLPTPNIFYRSFYCQGANVKLNAGTDFTYNWYDSNETFLKTGTDFSLDNIQENTTLFVKAQNGKNCISDAQQIDLSVDKVVADFVNNSELTLGEPIQFINHSSNATRYVWDFSEGEQSTETSPWHIFNLSGDKKIKLISFSANECSDTLIRNLSILSTGINQEKGTSNDGVLVYPNPVGNILHVELEDLNTQTVVSIFNMPGVLVYQTEFHEKLEADVSNFAPGIYTMLIKSKKNSQVIKIVKQ